MWTRRVRVWGAVASVVTCASVAHAECEPNVDCAEQAAPSAKGGWDSEETRRAEAEAQPTTRARSVPMVVTGFALVVAAPVLIIGGFASMHHLNPCPAMPGTECEGPSDVPPALMLGGVAALGLGIPLVIIGAQRETVYERPAATLSPYANPDGAGVSLRLSL